MTLERSLSERLKRIFDFDKVTFDRPSDSHEQEVLFVQVDSAKGRIKDGRETSRVQGKIHVFCNSDKMPFGYFAKSLAAAAREDVKDLFFFDFEENAGTFENISERTAGFVFLFDSQYDPALGTLNELDVQSSYQAES